MTNEIFSDDESFSRWMGTILKIILLLNRVDVDKEVYFKKNKNLFPTS